MGSKNQSSALYSRKEFVIPIILGIIASFLPTAVPMNQIGMLTCWLIFSVCILWLIFIFVSGKLLRFIVLFIAFISLSFLGYYRLKPCRVEVSVNSLVMTRLYAADPLPHEGTSYLHWRLQEPFYEWTVTIVPNEDIKEVAAVISHLKKEDREPQVVPGDAQIEKIQPVWDTGFEEPARTPDFYKRIVRFTNVPKDRKCTIKIRRPLKNANFSEKDVINVVVRAGSCFVDMPVQDDLKRTTKNLNLQAESIFYKLSIPVRSDPGVTPPGWVTATVDFYPDSP